MSRKVLGILIGICFLATSGFALDLGVANLPDTMSAGSTKLVANGGGVRKKFGLVKVYACALYLQQKSSNANAILAADQPMAIKLQVTSGKVNKDNLSEAIKEGFEKSTNGNIAPIKAQYDQFFALMSDPVNVNDVFDFIYIPGKGIECLKNGGNKGIIPGLEFKKAFYGIWLGNKPAQEDLKEKMLGK